MVVKCVCTRMCVYVGQQTQDDHLFYGTLKNTFTGLIRNELASVSGVYVAYTCSGKYLLCQG